MALVDFAQLLTYNQSLTALTRDSLTWRLDGKEVGKSKSVQVFVLQTEVVRIVILQAVQAVLCQIGDFKLK
jgi:hypothetical protein